MSILDSKQFFRIICGAGVVFSMLVSPHVQAMNAPLRIGTTTPIKDMSGRVLDGNAASPGDLVQIMYTDGGVIHPPDPSSGRPHFENAVISESAIGSLTSHKLNNPGYFATVLSRPQLLNQGLNGASIFVRIYNGPTAETSSHYADSKVYEVKGTKSLANFWIDVSVTDKAINMLADHDGDGLTDEAEMIGGTDPSKSDTDGDGMHDGIESYAGTNPLDASNYLAVTDLYKDGARWKLGWKSAEGRRYQIRFTADPLNEIVKMSSVGSPVVALADYTEIILPDEFAPVSNRLGCYHIELQ